MRYKNYFFNQPAFFKYRTMKGVADKVIPTLTGANILFTAYATTKVPALVAILLNFSSKPNLANALATSTPLKKGHVYDNFVHT